MRKPFAFRFLEGRCAIQPGKDLVLPLKIRIQYYHTYGSLSCVRRVKLYRDALINEAI